MTPTDGLPPAERRRAMTTLSIAICISVLATAIANIALPAIAYDLDVSPAMSVWVVNAYQLAVTVSLLPLSSLGDIYGYRRVYLFGLVVFCFGSLACGLAGTLPLLVAGRVLQGLGAAGIMSVNTALVRYIYPRHQLGRGVGMTALIVAPSSAAGPSLAAGILAVASWQWLFIFNVPLGILALALALRSLPATPRSGHSFDLSSALLNAASFGLVFVGIDGLGHGRGMALSLALLAIGLGVGTVFVRRQLSLPAPMLPVDLFRLPVFALSVITSVCSYACQTLAQLSLPFYFQYAGHQSQTETGLLMTPWPAVVILIAPIAGRLSDRYPAGLLGGCGLAVLSVGMLLLTGISADAHWTDVAWRMLVCGIGFGFFQSPNNRAMIGAAPRERSGAGSGMLSTARLTGQTIGGLIVALLLAITGGTVPGVAHAASLSLMIGAGFAMVAMVMSFLRLRAAPTL